MGVCGRNLVQHPDEPLLGMGGAGVRVPEAIPAGHGRSFTLLAENARAWFRFCGYSTN